MLMGAGDSLTWKMYFSNFKFSIVNFQCLNYRFPTFQYSHFRFTVHNFRFQSLAGVALGGSVQSSLFSFEAGAFGVV